MAPPAATSRTVEKKPVQEMRYISWYPGRECWISRAPGDQYEKKYFRQHSDAVIRDFGEGARALDGHTGQLRLPRIVSALQVVWAVLPHSEGSSTVMGDGTIIRGSWHQIKHLDTRVQSGWCCFVPSRA